MNEFVVFVRKQVFDVVQQTVNGLGSLRISSFKLPGVLIQQFLKDTVLVLVLLQVVLLGS